VRVNAVLAGLADLVIVIPPAIGLDRGRLATGQATATVIDHTARLGTLIVFAAKTDWLVHGLLGLAYTIELNMKHS